MAFDQVIQSNAYIKDRNPTVGIVKCQSLKLSMKKCAMQAPALGINAVQTYARSGFLYE